ncbi:MAG TPA: hypothetical protein PLQ82_14800 [Desulfobacteraceae bacterium]|nr:hypothetical protein [Desulfobacteraceae bacterium]HPQ29738.1 hypothetical protein [Desulfobacteraceae bacterium]
MDILSANELRSLMQKQVGICISIYMPALGKGVEAQQNQILFKNLLRNAEEKLISNDLTSSEVTALLYPAQQLMADPAFWRKQYAGLALFISQEVFLHYRIPQTFEELVVVTDRFHIKPLIPLLKGSMEFFILAVSQKNVKLFKCFRYSIEQIKLEGIPEGLDDALNLDNFEKHLQLHTGAEDTKTKILRYLQQVDKGLHEFFRDRRGPLVFAGVDYLFPIFKEANTYSNLLEEAISGNPDTLDHNKLHELAWPIVHPFFNKDMDDAISKYKQNAGTGLVSSDVKEIVRAAYHKRVAVLFVPVGVQQWGSFYPDSDQVFLNNEPAAGQEDLLDFAAIQTFLNRGKVYALDPNDMPDREQIAAIFRY